jgi:hypothetical protein
MTRTLIAPLITSRAGTVQVTTPATAQMSFANDEKALLSIKNGSGVTLTGTVAIPLLVDGRAVAALPISIAAGVTAVFGPFPSNVYNQADGSVYFDLGATTTIEVMVLKAGTTKY